MKRFLPILLALVSSCSLKQYTLQVADPIQLYGQGGVDLAPITELRIDDTLTVITKSKRSLAKTSKAYYKSTAYWTTEASRKTKIIRTRRLSRKAYKRSYALYIFPDEPSERASRNASRGASTSKPYGSTPSTGATIYTGPRGGRYYINSKGNKVYVKSGTSHSSRSSARRSSSSSFHKSSGSSYRKSSGSSYRGSTGSSYRRK